MRTSMLRLLNALPWSTPPPPPPAPPLMNSTAAAIAAVVISVLLAIVMVILSTRKRVKPEPGMSPDQRVGGRTEGAVMAGAAEQAAPLPEPQASHASVRRATHIAHMHATARWGSLQQCHVPAAHMLRRSRLLRSPKY
jgi:hypothetical protein